MLTFVGRHPRQVAASIPSSHARHVLLSVVMSASQQLEALVCYRKDRTAPAISLLQQTSLPHASTSVLLHDMHSSAADRLETGFDHLRFFGYLPTQTSLGEPLIAARQLESTQTLLQDNTSVVPDNAVCIAYQQVGGKGRGGNKWDSPAGCLMFSILIRVSIAGQSLPFVQYIATLAIVQAVQQLAQQRLQGSSLDVRIKWPNDIYSSGMKIGGVLCHSTYRSKEFQVVIGVGLNLDNSQPTTCVNDILQDRHAELQQQSTWQPITREELLACILDKLQGLLATLVATGFAPLQQAYLQAWLHSNQQVTLIEAGNKQVALTVRGLTDYGYLLADDELGTPFALHPDGNSLDFFKGLIRHKLR
ncbi:hypothetical protein ABBQ32_009434 [Trebouxia sp. C0010 RCD-2024]